MRESKSQQICGFRNFLNNLASEIIYPTERLRNCLIIQNCSGSMKIQIIQNCEIIYPAHCQNIQTIQKFFYNEKN